jgi:hypothetical protein
LGDFNLPLVNWKNMTYPSDGIQDCLISFCQQHSLDQLVSEPTRYDNILDLLFVSDPHVVTNYIITPPLSTGDHNVVLFSTVGLVSADNHEIVRERISIALWNEDAISKAEQFIYSFDWSSILVYSISPEEIWQGFKNVLLHCVSTFAKVNVYHGSDDRSLELNWHTHKNIKRLTTSKKYLWQKLRNKRNPNRNLLLRKYKAVCKLIYSKIRLAKFHVEKMIINSNDVKKFYKFANQKLSNKKKRIQTIQSPSGKLTIDSLEKAELFNTFFSNCYTDDNHLLPDMDKHLLTTPSTELSIINFPVLDVFSIVSNLSNSHTITPDGFSAKTIKVLGKALAEPLSRLFEFFSCMRIYLVIGN